MKRNSSGMSLLAILVAVAVLGVIAATLAALFGNLSSTLMRGNVEAQERAVINYVRVLLAQPQVCDYAMRMALPSGATPPVSPPDVVWDFVANPAAASDITYLINNRQGLGPASVAVKAGTLSPDLIIKKIYIRGPKPELGEGPALAPDPVRYPGAPHFPVIVKMAQPPGQTSPVPQTFDIAAAKVVVRFEVTGNAPILGSPIRELTADVTVAVDRVSKVISFCHQETAVQAIDLACDSTHLYTGEPDCPVSNDPCFPLYFIRGFDSLGVPICSCQTSCQDILQGPVGPGPTAPGPTAPGPGPFAPRIGPGPVKPQGHPGAGPSGAGPTSPGAGPTSSPGAGPAPGGGPTSGGCGPAGN